MHIVNNQPLYVAMILKREIYDTFQRTLKAKKAGLNLFFTDIDKIKQQMLKELEKDKKNDIVNN